LNVTERLIRGIDSFWSAFANKFRFDNSSDNRKKQAHAEDEIDEEIANSSACVQRRYDLLRTYRQINFFLCSAREAAKWAAQKEEFKSKFHSTKSLKSKTGIEEYDDYMEETDRDLDDIADSIADIKELALGMRVSLHKDMAHLDRTVAEVERANDRTKKQRMKIESMK
jgi:hypothetical protein